MSVVISLLPRICIGLNNLLTHSSIYVVKEFYVYFNMYI